MQFFAYSYMYWGTSSQLSAIIKIDLGIGIEKQLAVMNAYSPTHIGVRARAESAILLGLPPSLVLLQSGWAS